jgi:glutamate-ammonia-ligase adenylyltransferase
MSRRLFARLAVLAFDVLDRTPDPDMALNNWDRFAAELPNRENHYQSLLSQPGRLEILLSILSGSQFLADILIRNPDFLEWVSDPERISAIRRQEEMEED